MTDRKPRESLWSKLAPIAVALALSAWISSNCRAAEPLPTRDSILHDSLAHDERVWREVASDPIRDVLQSRDIFAYALGLCETKTHPERLERLFDVAARMQDRAAKSPTFGNFHWSWRDPSVYDPNADDFCMQCAAPLWLRHRDALPASAKAKLREILELAVEGLQRHKVKETYTNIALMNACDLILLGESLDKPAAAEEGYLRLDAVCWCIWDEGVHEYVSPTYYGTDLDDLTILAAFCRRERGRAQARALLELFWTDIAVNWFPPAEKLAGAQSRTYDYLQGLGYLDQQLMANGWLGLTPKRRIIAVETMLGDWRPPERLKELSQSKFPRVVRQNWGAEPGQTRTHVLHRDVTLSTAAAGYGGRMDMPLTVDLPGPRESVRCYFIADGRHDPYGKSKIPAGKAHEKTLHLNPFFTAAQRQDDALGLAIYRDADLPTPLEALESHFVMPRAVDGCWIGEMRIALDDGKDFEIPVQTGVALVLRKGSAAVGVRIAWARGCDGHDAPASLVADGNPYGAMRLTVVHRAGGGNLAKDAVPGAAFWVRIGSALTSDDAFEKWRRDFASAKAEFEADDRQVRIRAAGVDGPLLLSATAPYEKAAEILPRPSHSVLQLDGEDVGRRILQEIEPIKSYLRLAADAPVPIAADRSTYFEAEAGFVASRMVVADDPAASGGHFAWMPALQGAEAGRGGPGSVSFALKVAQPGEYYAWGRVLRPSSKSDSFAVRVAADAEVLRDATWATGAHRQWAWTRIPLGGKSSDGVRLPAGNVRLQIRVREDGAKLDRLFITPRADEEPK